MSSSRSHLLSVSTFGTDGVPGGEESRCEPTIPTGYHCDLSGDGSMNAIDVQFVINAALWIEI